MNQYFKCFFILFCSGILFSGTVTGQTFGKKPVWEKSQLIEPSAMMALLKNPNAKKPPLYNIGFVSNIPGSVNLGAARDQSGLAKLKNAVKSVSKDRMVVIYCGCCPFENCPNVRPAYQLLQDLGYKKTKILNLPTSLKADWIDKGYPVNKDLKTSK
ncbi:rhodanese-like domain-containing protein [Pedobacter immunditicola]|uniref:rhodanese-like domain-containing protein n=1 Tax=Pedobacter immunditicola TaxID=3133440 RepID=UPI00309BB445